jgi:hypothetical protein
MQPHIDQQSEIDALNGLKPFSMLSKVKTKRAPPPPIFLIYGHQGLGKTTLACEFPNPIVFDFEGGIPESSPVASIGGENFKTYKDFLAALRSLATEAHEYDTLVIDSVDALEPLIVAQVCLDFGVTDLSKAGMGAGYKTVAKVWRELMDGLKWLNTHKNMIIILLGHAKSITHEDAVDGAYSKHTINLSNQGRDAVLYLTSNILFLSQQSRIEQEDLGFNNTHKTVKSTGSRVLYCDARPAFEAKNRCGLPDRIFCEKGKGFEAIATYMPSLFNQPTQG